MVAIIIWVSAIASAFVDNIPFAATMVPVIQSLAALNGVNISTLAWGLSMGTDIGGSATPIGASANVVGMSVIAKEGLHRWMGQILQECSSGNNYRNGGCNSRNLAQILLMERNVIVWN